MKLIMAQSAATAIYSVVRKDKTATDVDSLSPNIDYVPSESAEVTIETRSVCGDTNRLIPEESDKKKKSLKVTCVI